MAKPKYVRGMSALNADYFEKGRGHGSDYDKGSNQYIGNELLQDGYSRVAHQDAPDPVAYTQSRTARKGGGFDLGEKQYIYKKVKQKEAPAQQAAPAVEPEDDLVIKQRDPIKHSSEIQEAKERATNYQQNITTDSAYSPDKFQSEQRALDLDKYQFQPNR